MRLLNKVAVITGAANGIGAACARKFCKEGAQVIIADVDSDAATALVDELNAEFSAGAATTSSRNPPGGSSFRKAEEAAIFVRCDMTAMRDVEAVFVTAEETFGGVDILVNNAAIQNTKPLMETSEEEWAQVLDVNLGSVFRGMKAAVPRMRRRGGGAIVNISSSFAIVGSQGYAAYHASKGGVSSLTRAAAVDLIRENIRVNAVCPGTTLTPGLRKGVEATCGERDPESMMQSYLAKQVMGRFGEATEIANVVAFLAGDEASFVVGANVVADGAYTVV